MINAHTPGPWEWDGNALRPMLPQPDRHAVHTILCDEGGFGFLCSKPSQTLAELDANKRLIGASPRLLEALVDLLAAARLAEARLVKHDDLPAALLTTMHNAHLLLNALEQPA